MNTMPRDTNVTFPRSELFDILSDNLAASSCNADNLNPDGTVGPNMRQGLLEFTTNEFATDNINLMIRLLRAGGYNDALVTDGKIGDELIKAINTLLEENGQPPFTEEELELDEE